MGISRNYGNRRCQKRNTAERPSRRHRFADPWGFRSARRFVIEPATDLFGRRLAVRCCCRNGRLVQVVALEARDEMPPATSMLPDLQRRVAAEISSYRMSGECSEADVALVEALWRDGKGLRAYARERGVEPQAISDHIERLKHRCPRFYLWWVLKNRRRREASRRRFD